MELPGGLSVKVETQTVVGRRKAGRGGKGVGGETRAGNYWRHRRKKLKMKVKGYAVIIRSLRLENGKKGGEVIRKGIRKGWLEGGRTRGDGEGGYNCLGVD